MKKKKEKEKNNDFFQIFFSGLGWTGKLWSNPVVLILRNKEDKFFLKNSAEKKYKKK